MDEYRYHGGQLIGGGGSCEGSSTFTVSGASTGKPLPGVFHEAVPEEIDQALYKADQAFEAHERTAPTDRAELLERSAHEIEVLGERLVDRAVAETALGAARIRSERQRTVNQLRMFAQLVREGSWVDARINTPIPDRVPIPKPDLRRMAIPVGPVAVFGASNFPLAFSVAGGDTASALAAGCPVVVKAHPAHPGASELVGSALQRAVKATGFHPGTFSMLHGKSPEVGLRLVQHPILQSVGFTGSLIAGRALFDAAASRPRPIPVHAEMGSTNPVFILPDALSTRGDAIAKGLAASVTLGAGQFCTKPGLIFLWSRLNSSGEDTDRAAPARAFIESVATALHAVPPFTMLHESICDAYRERKGHLLGIDGVEPVHPRAPKAGRCSRVEEQGHDPCGPGEKHELRIPEQEHGGAEAPGKAEAAVFATGLETFLCEGRLREEWFGPGTLIVVCRDFAEMEQAARSLGGNLTATLHGTSKDLAHAERLVQIVRRQVGRLVFNGYPTGVEVCPSMHHGGPFPASTDARSTSVGTAAIHRFVRPICYQNFPHESLPAELRDQNPRHILRLIDGITTRDPVGTSRAGEIPEVPRR